MSVEFNQLIQRFDSALKNKEAGKFSNEDVKSIHDAANEYFRDDRSVPQDELMKIRDKWVDLSEGKIDKARAMKKLQGTSRAEAIRAVLDSAL